MQTTKRQDVETSHGRIAVESKGQGEAVVFIHGNSACRQVFRKQLTSPLLGNHHLITFDLPGHGDSSDATDPVRTYTLPGLADLVIELLDKMGVGTAAIVGASLGGHLAIELLAQSTIPQGLFLMGTPAVGTNMGDGFLGKPLDGLGSQPVITVEQAERFAKTVFGPDYEPFMQRAVERTDREFRGTLFAGAARGAGANQREMLTSTNVPTAIVNGVEDRIVNLDYIESVPYSSLWRGKCYRIADASHSPFWEAPDVVNILLSEFLTDLVDSPREPAARSHEKV
ncbi:alpha/beta hydrolase [Mesorhizobium sp. M0659]|uniref:alpha/beta fold hydrolase n=1 Tax=Mesorhizobium sp. M0659 TaxID=2956980 RepID=UPI003336FCD0